MPYRVLPAASLAVLLCLLGASVSSAQSCQTYTGLTYATAQNLHLELLVPQGAPAPVPVVVWIHGGGWKSGSRLPIPTRVSDLCLRGYAVASVDYRLTTTALWPAQIQDVRGAVRWLRAHASEYGLDTDRFAAWGESAGGHLAALLATSGGVPTITIGSVSADLEGTTGGNLDPSSRVQAVVDWYGATDFLQMRFYPTTVNHDGATSDESKLIGGAIQDNPERVATADPITYVDAGDPPLLAMHGTLDKLIPFNQSQLLVDALNAAGASATLRPVQGAGHGGSAFDKASVVQPVYDFLDAALLEPAPPPPVPPAPAVDASVVVQASDRNASETGDPGRFTVTRNSVSGDLAVAYTVSGTATAGVDYAALSGTVTIPSGQASADVVVTPIDDDVLETAETVILALQGGSTASVVLADVEPVRPVVSVSLSDPDAAEPADAGEFIVWRTGSAAEPLTVDLLASGTAGHGTDYALPLTVTIAASWDRVFVKTAPIDDYVTEDPETVTLTVDPSPSIHAGPYAGSTVTIRDDDVSGTPELTGLALNPTSATGSKTATGTVVLDHAAPAGGAPVSLSSSDPAVASVPASVTVAQGATSATFTVTTSSVASAKTVTISASRRGITQSAALAVLAPAVSALTLTPGTFAGGCKSSTGKVTLTAKAPAGGIVVPLTNTNPVAVVPASVTVAAGSTSAAFAITAPAVTANQSGTVTASFGGGSYGAGLTVRPIGVASLALSPNPVIGPAPVQGTVTLECPAGPGGIAGIAVALSSSSTGVARPDVASLTIPAGASQGTFSVTTADVTVQSYARIKATANGLARSVKLTVDP
ncbi:MAG: alpha/beta hydrolase fold domain-containing protein [Thermoanaerobaculia bacterium]